MLLRVQTSKTACPQSAIACDLFNVSTKIARARSATLGCVVRGGSRPEACRKPLLVFCVKGVDLSWGGK